MKAAASTALAESLILGIDDAQGEGHPLSQVQVVSLAKMAIMAYQGIVEAADALAIDVGLEEASQFVRDMADERG